MKFPEETEINQPEDKVIEWGYQYPTAPCDWGKGEDFFYALSLYEGNRATRRLNGKRGKKIKLVSLKELKNIKKGV